MIDLSHGSLPTNPPDEDKFRDECGVFGVLGHSDAAVLTALGLHALQHRGQEAVGIVSFDGSRFNSERHMGLVGEAFSQKKSSRLERLPGYAAIGHVRYATTGATVLRNVQPLYADMPRGGIALCHNGNLTNAKLLRRRLEEKGSIFQSTSDTETVLHLIATSRYQKVADRMAEAFTQVSGAYSFVFLTNKKLVGVRDPYGVRPLVIGKLGDAHILASETCALDIIGAEYVRDVEPGEMVIFEIGKEMRSLRPFPAKPRHFCIFEYVYFSRADSTFDGLSVYDARKHIGEELAKESPADADIVLPVPDSGVPSALGFAEQTGLPFDYGIIKNNYVGRSFIQPTQQSRQQAVRMKHSPNRVVLEGKRVVLVDDSIVRGTTSLGIVQMVRDAGAKEVHMRIASPPTIASCFYGVNTPVTDELIASRMSTPEIERYLKLDSLAYLSIDGLYRAMGRTHRDPDHPGFCDACFTAEYPLPLPDKEEGDHSRQLSFLQ
jgi:amidophosphoribosyltransferase